MKIRPTVSEAKAAPENLPHLIRNLDDAEEAPAALDILQIAGDAATKRLIRVAYRDNDLAKRGWAIAALGRIGGKEADECLANLASASKQPELVRIWAAAARIKISESPAELETAAELLNDYPMLDRPIAKALARHLAADKGRGDSVGTLLALAVRTPKWEKPLAGTILAGGAPPLIEQLLHARDAEVRRKAAAYLATLDQQGDPTATPRLLEALAFLPASMHVPWDSGPLFVPALKWQRDDARRLAAALIGWHAWCGESGQVDDQNKINVVLGSTGLAGPAGYNPLGQKGIASEQWLAEFRRALGDELANELLKARES